MSRKLDALITEKFEGISTYCDGGAWRTYKEFDDGGCEWGYCTNYSTNIAAVDILGKMRADGWHYSIDTWPAIICNNPDLVGVTFGKLASDLTRWENEYAFVAPTIELAICIAALLARGVTQAEIDEALGVTA